MFSLVYGSHTEQAYSSDHRTRDLYACFLTVVELMLMFLRMNPSVLFAFVVMLFIWNRHTHTTIKILAEHVLTLIPNTTNTLTTQTAIILSVNYTKLEQPPPEHYEE
jgi:hypothetical protein